MLWAAGTFVREYINAREKKGFCVKVWNIVENNILQIDGFSQIGNGHSYAPS